MLSDEHRALFAQAAATRRRTELSCLECGARFPGLAWARYCSKRCQNRATQRAYRARPKPLRAQTPLTPADLALWQHLPVP